MRDVPEFGGLEELTPLNEIEDPSRSQLKREAEAMQKLGERLIKLDAAKLSKINMPEELEEAILLARKINANGGIRRQRQLIGKIIRKIGADQIIYDLAKLDAGHFDNVREQHTLENWITALQNNDNTVFDQIKEFMPTMDLQLIRQLLRNSQKELAQNKPPKSKRALFRYLRECYQWKDNENQTT
ncbi:ribosome-associated UPF0307 family protein [Gammaproteobacteria bacterium]|nr:ribosome-associated UPF0307 family protein [Gammaproteobacteria bacterium]